jgi:phosphatidylserine/phosphatidylglycerophosphate/cardiolipin synthase-like enzyme
MMPLATNTDAHLPKRGRREDQESDAEAEEKASEALVNKESKRVTAGRSVQPILPEMRFLWHDIQLLIKGPAARVLYLHFMQRWIHSFSPNPNTTKSFVLHSPPKKTCTKHRALKLKGLHNNCEVRLHRTWKGVFDVNFLFDMHKKLLQNARKFLYIEHQYPFQNFALAYTLCEALKKNPELQVIIVTPVKTDLPTGLVGELFDWSQDHIIDHLQVIHRTAPDRVGIYGLVNQDKNKSDQIRSIYVHSKMIIVDDEYIVTGSTNLDNVSFHYSSELSVSIFNKALARETRIRLFKEHLGHFYEKEMDDNFDLCFRAYHHIASLNLRSFAGSTSEQTVLHGRPVFMAPEENYQLLLKKVYYPNKITKFLTKMGVSGSPGDDLKQLVTSGYNKVRGIIKMAKL